MLQSRRAKPAAFFLRSFYTSALLSNELALLFDFTHPEVWEGMKMVKGNE